MNINELLGGVKCQACGKTHNCDIESIFVESGAISHLGKLCEKYEKIMNIIQICEKIFIFIHIAQKFNFRLFTAYCF
jgi:hypothetical protein